MLTPKPLATAIAALALCAGTASADGRHRNEIHIESFSWGTSSSSAAAGDLAVSAPGRSLPAVQGLPETITVHGYRTEAAGVAPLTPLEDPRPKAQTSSKPQSEYMSYRLYDLLISSYQTSATDSAAPAKQRLVVVPPASPASTPMLKLKGIDPKPAIAINSPLRTLPNRSPVVDGSSSTLMAGEKSLRQAPLVARSDASAKK